MVRASQDPASQADLEANFSQPDGNPSQSEDDPSEPRPDTLDAISVSLNNYLSHHLPHESSRTPLTTSNTDPSPNPSPSTSQSRVGAISGSSSVSSRPYPSSSRDRIRTARSKSADSSRQIDAHKRPATLVTPQASQPVSYEPKGNAAFGEANATSHRGRRAMNRRSSTGDMAGLVLPPDLLPVVSSVGVTNGLSPTALRSGPSVVPSGRQGSPARSGDRSPRDARNRSPRRSVGSGSHPRGSRTPSPGSTRRAGLDGSIRSSPFDLHVGSVKPECPCLCGHILFIGSLLLVILGSLAYVIYSETAMSLMFLLYGSLIFACGSVTFWIYQAGYWRAGLLAFGSIVCYVVGLSALQTLFLLTGLAVLGLLLSRLQHSVNPNPFFRR